MFINVANAYAKKNYIKHKKHSNTHSSMKMESSYGTELLRNLYNVFTSKDFLCVFVLYCGKRSLRV